MRVRSVMSAVVVTALAAWGAVAPATATTTARYVGAGVGVVSAGGQTPVDNGVVACDTGEGVGGGGFCLPFGSGNAVHVVDDVLGENVAFQVCLDNNGDNFCSSPDPDPVCGDEIVFSHADDGTFFNPVGPVRGGFKPDCPGGVWRGYVVLLCEGVHVAGGAHAHPATTGTGTLTNGAEGLGTFCGGNFIGGEVSGRKAYVAVGGNLTCGMSVAKDPQVEGSHTGVIVGGPWRKVDGAAVALTCTVQTGVGEPQDPDAASATGPSTTRASFLPPSGVTFSPGSDEAVYLCTNVRWQGPQGPESFDYDVDPYTPGTQCPQAIQGGEGDFTTYVVAQSAT